MSIVPIHLAAEDVAVFDLHWPAPLFSLTTRALSCIVLRDRGLFDVPTGGHTDGRKP